MSASQSRLVQNNINNIFIPNILDPLIKNIIIESEQPLILCLDQEDLFVLVHSYDDLSL